MNSKAAHIEWNRRQFLTRSVKAAASIAAAGAAGLWFYDSRGPTAAVEEQSETKWLDYSMYHLDGSQAIRHLECLLEIKDLDAIEFTAEPNVPSAGSPYWYDTYRKILDAGKSIQAWKIQACEVLPLLDAIGAEGVYLMVYWPGLAPAEKLAKQLEKYK